MACSRVVNMLALKTDEIRTGPNEGNWHPMCGACNVTDDVFDVRDTPEVPGAPSATNHRYCII